MSSTRHARPGDPLNQEKFCSSAEFEPGLNAYLISKRLAKIKEPWQRELVWWLQFKSHQEGGLGGFLVQFLARFGNRVGTETMLQLRGVDRDYTPEEARSIRAELERGSALTEDEELAKFAHDALGRNYREATPEESGDPLIKVALERLNYILAEHSERGSENDYSVKAFADVCLSLAKGKC